MVQRRILNVIHAPVWGGIHSVAERVGPVCKTMGHDWVMVLPDEREDNGAERLEAAGLETVSIPIKRIRKTLSPGVQATFLASIPGDITRLKNLALERNCDVIQVAGLMHFHGAIAAGRAGLPLVWQLHSDQPPMFLKRFFVPMVKRRAHSFMTAGKSLINTHPGLETAASRLVPFMSPVDVKTFFADATKRTKARQLLNVEETDIVIGAVGGRGPNKNHGLLVEVAKRLKDEIPNLRVRICGPQPPQHAAWFETNVVAPARDAGLLESGHVGFAEPGLEVPLYMNGFDVFALPSRGEGSPLVVAEAMATGLPVVANAVGSVPDSVRHEKTGFLNRSLSVEDMTEYVRRLALDPDLRARFGSEGRRVAEAEFSLEACAQAHVDAVEMAISNAAAGLPVACERNGGPLG